MVDGTKNAITYASAKKVLADYSVGLGGAIQEEAKDITDSTSKLKEAAKEVENLVLSAVEAHHRILDLRAAFRDAAGEREITQASEDLIAALEKQAQKETALLDESKLGAEQYAADKKDIELDLARSIQKIRAEASEKLEDLEGRRLDNLSKIEENLDRYQEEIEQKKLDRRQKTIEKELQLEALRIKQLRAEFEQEITTDPSRLNAALFREARLQLQLANQRITEQSALEARVIEIKAATLQEIARLNKEYQKRIIADDAAAYVSRLQLEEIEQGKRIRLFKKAREDAVSADAIQSSTDDYIDALEKQQAIELEIAHNTAATQEDLAVETASIRAKYAAQFEDINRQTEKNITQVQIEEQLNRLNLLKLYQDERVRQAQDAIRDANDPSAVNAAEQQLKQHLERQAQLELQIATLTAINKAELDHKTTDIQIQNRDKLVDAERKSSNAITRINRETARNVARTEREKRRAIQQTISALQQTLSVIEEIADVIKTQKERKLTIKDILPLIGSVAGAVVGFNVAGVGALEGSQIGGRLGRAAGQIFHNPTTDRLAYLAGQRVQRQSISNGNTSSTDKRRNAQDFSEFFSRGFLDQLQENSILPDANKSSAPIVNNYIMLDDQTIRAITYKQDQMRNQRRI